MKRNSFVLAALAACAAVACGTKVSDKTTLEGAFVADAPDEVTITIQDLGIDTTVAVTEGKFSVELPVCKTAFATLTADGVRNKMFVSDGTPLTFSVNEEGEATIVSKTPSASVQERFRAYADAIMQIEKDARAKLAACEEGDDLAKSEIYNALETAETELNKKAFDENKDNIIGVSAFRDLQYDYTPVQIDSMLNLFDPSLAENPTIVKIKKANDAKKATGEGAMFIDFDINGVKLSDYVGKGKYVLVDFWASWCGPCKREIPNVKNVYEKYKGDDFDVLSVAVWDKPEETIATAKAYGVNWNQIIDAQRIPTDIYGIQGIPHIILFGPDGVIIKRGLHGEGIEEEVAKYVTAKK